jgi:hypothetical protein
MKTGTVQPIDFCFLLQEHTMSFIDAFLIALGLPRLGG